MVLSRSSSVNREFADAEIEAGAVFVLVDQGTELGVVCCCIYFENLMRFGVKQVPERLRCGWLCHYLQQFGRDAALCAPITPPSPLLSLKSDFRYETVFPAVHGAFQNLPRLDFP